MKNFLFIIFLCFNICLMKKYIKNNFHNKQRLKVSCNEKFSILNERYINLLENFKKLQNESSSNRGPILRQVINSDGLSRSLEECRSRTLRLETQISRCNCNTPL